MSFLNATRISPVTPSHAARSSYGLIAGYVLLFLSLVVFDQSTKFHSESRYLVWSHTSDIRSYRSTKEHVQTWGVSPSLMHDKSLSADAITPNWVDFHLTYVRNPGAAWGSFADAPETTRLLLFYTVTAVVTGVIFYLLYTSHPGQRLARASLTLILAGAAGNLIDRLLLRYVIDWIQFQWRLFGWKYSFPVFNAADVAINVGLGLLVLDMLLSEVALARARSTGKRIDPT